MAIFASQIDAAVRPEIFANARESLSHNSVFIEALRPPSSKDTHQMAIFVHGALAALHLLGTVYNLKRRHRWQTVAHVAGVAFSAHSAVYHIRESRS